MIKRPDAAELAMVPTLRAAAQNRVEQTSLRAVARGVGMTPSGLSKFLEGGEPLRRTIRLLEAWYVRSQADSADGIPSAASAAAAIRVLAVCCVPEARGEFVDRLLADVRKLSEGGVDWRASLNSYSEYLKSGEPHPQDG